MSAGSLFHPDFASTHGCAWFEPSGTGVRDLNNCGGWYSIAGLPAVRFEQWKTLPEEVVWWTNLTRDEAWQTTRFDRIREGGLFGPDWSGWLAERASPDELAQVPVVCAGVSETFARAGSWLATWCHQLPQARPWAWEDGTMPDLLAERLGWHAEPVLGPQRILEAAYAEEIIQRLPAQSLAGHRRLILSFPRREHANWLFRQRHPQGQWQELEESAWPRNPDRIGQWLVEESLPLLVKVSALAWNEPDDALSLLWLGARGTRFAGAERESFWLTGEEARVLSRHAQFAIDGVYRAQGWTNTPPPPGFDLAGEENPLVDLALSQELLAASLWRAAASPTREAGSRRRADFSARAVWWRAYDRQRCFEAARRLLAAGYRVNAHGQGQVAVVFDPATDPKVLAEAIVEAGLLLPGLLARALPLAASAQPSTPQALDHWLKRESSLEGRLDIDRLVAPWLGPTQVQPILRDAAGRLLSLPSPNAEWSKAWSQMLRAQARQSVDRIKRSLGRT